MSRLWHLIWYGHCPQWAVFKEVPLVDKYQRTTGWSYYSKCHYPGCDAVRCQDVK